MTDRELLAGIRQMLADSPFVGEGHRKLWARLRRRGIRTSRKRVLRLTREAGLLAPTARVRKRAARLHEGTITVEVPDTPLGDRRDRGLVCGGPLGRVHDHRPRQRRGVV